MPLELIDLYPTFGELAGFGDDLPAILQGKSAVPFLDQPEEIDLDETAYTITRSQGGSLRTNRWRYNRWGEDARGTNEELYDHSTDPFEHQNLARDSAHQPILDQLRSAFNQVRSRARAEGYQGQD